MVNYFLLKFEYEGILKSDPVQETFFSTLILF